MNASAAQIQELQAQVCPNTHPMCAAIKPLTDPRHGLIATTGRSWRDWFRKRTYWRCWYCDLRVEVIRDEV